MNEDKKEKIADETTLYLFVYPAFPNFLIVFLFQFYANNSDFWYSFIIASLAGITGVIGSLCTLVWLADMYEPLSWVLGITLWVVAIFGIGSILLSSLFFIIKSLKKLF